MRSKVKSQIWEGVDIVIFLPQQSSNSLDSLLQRSHIRLPLCISSLCIFSMYIVFYNFQIAILCTVHRIICILSILRWPFFSIDFGVRFIEFLYCSVHLIEWMEGWCLSELVEMPINDQYHSSISWGLRYWTFSWSWNA